MSEAIGNRRLARRLAVQALYQWQMGGHSSEEIAHQFESDKLYGQVEQSYFKELVREVPLKDDEIVSALGTCLDRDFQSVSPIEQAILRIGCYELVNRVDVPFRVVLNECVELAKQFGADESHRYINGVLDKLARQCRQTEVRARS